MLLYYFFFFFFFKQKTAYEMRISDWSSDVCSSDLVTPFSIRVPRTFCEQTENTKWNSSNRGSTVASRRRRLGDCRSGLIRVDCSGLITSSRTFLARVSVSALIFL